MKIHELRRLYQKVSGHKPEDGDGKHDPLVDRAYDDSDASFISEEIGQYFAQEKGVSPHSTGRRNGHHHEKNGFPVTDEPAVAGAPV